MRKSGLEAKYFLDKKMQLLYAEGEGTLVIRRYCITMEDFIFLFKGNEDRITYR